MRRVFMWCFTAALCSAYGQNQGLLISNTVGTGYFNVTNVVGLGPANITVEAWVTYDETTLTPPPTNVWPTIVRKNFNPGAEEYLLRVDAGGTANRNLRWSVLTPSGRVNCLWAFGPGELLNLTHVAATWDGSTARILINGVEVATALGTGGLVDNGGAIRVGSGDAATPEFWNGVLDDVRIWSVARTPAQIASTMFAPQFAQPGLEASWILDGDVLDYTGNGHDGVIVPTANFVPVTLPAILYQQNSTNANFAVNGVQSSGLAAAVTSSTVGSMVTVSASSPLVGNGWELAYQLGPLIPAATITGGGQIVNVDLGSVQWLNGGAVPNLVPFPGGFSVPLSTPIPGDLSGQCAWIDPANSDGLSISQGAQVTTVADPSLGPGSPTCAPGATILPLGDDSFSQQTLGFTFNYFGVGYTQVFVGSNGHCTFNAGNTGWAGGGPALAGAAPTIAVCSEDLNPGAGGSVTFSTNNTDTFEVCWTGVPSFGATNSNDLKVSAINGGAILFDYGNVDELEGTVGLSPGANLRIPTSLNLSAAGGFNGPIVVGASDMPFQDFTVGGDQFDLDNLQIIWLLDASGSPISIQ